MRQKCCNLEEECLEYLQEETVREKMEKKHNEHCFSTCVFGALVRSISHKFLCFFFGFFSTQN